MGQLDMVAQGTTSVSLIGELDLRRRIDRAVSRALFDGEYASVLLTDPTAVLEDRNCPPQQYLSLLSIHASDLGDFARQARALFWMAQPLERHPSPEQRHRTQAEQRHLAAAAAS
jgi:hypothetical protein